MNIKRLVSTVLMVVMVFALVACGKKAVDETKQDVTDKEQQIEETVDNNDEDAVADNDNNDKPIKDEQPKEENKKPAVNHQTKPEEMPVINTQKPETKPETKPVPTPENKPEVKPQEQATTAGQKLLADFKTKADASSATAIAEAISGNSIIPFSTAVAPVSTGHLAGFGNAEINGFKEGAMFGPVIGSVPFVGYVFVLDDGANVSGFIANLEANADLRWNICVEAEEMVAGSVGNKVFFVMCNKDLNTEE